MATRRLIVSIVVGWSLILSAGAVSAQTGRAAALSDLRIDDEVDGDVVVLAGNVFLGPQAHVRGHVVAVFGRITSDPAARVDGRRISISSLAGLRMAPGGEPSGLEMAIWLLTFGSWLLATSIVAFTFPARVRFGTWLVPTLGFKMLVLGAMVYLTVFAGFVAVIGIGPTVGVPLLIMLALVFLAARALGLAILGGWLIQRWLPRPVPVGVPVFVGVLLLLGLRLLPVVGGPVWIVVSIASLGIAVFTVAMAPQRGQLSAAGISRQ